MTRTSDPEDVSEQPPQLASGLDDLIERGRALPSAKTGVVYPLSRGALLGAVEAASDNLIDPVLIGPPKAIRQLAVAEGTDISGIPIVEAEDDEAAAAQAAAMAGHGELQALMKGSLHTDTFLHAIMKKESGLRTGRLLSHCALIYSPDYGRRIILTDAAINIAPDLDQKCDICQNAIIFARAVGIVTPKVAVLSAVETVEAKMPSTVDAAALAKMADRGQIVGGIVDGPLDLDAAVSPDVVRIKHIHSRVAGQADILLAANIEAGNAMYKEFLFMDGAQAADCVMGARVPIILTSRADSPDTRTYSAAVAAIVAHAIAKDPSLLEG